MANIVCYLDLEGISEKISAKALFFFQLVLFINIFDYLLPFFWYIKPYHKNCNQNVIYAHLTLGFSIHRSNKKTNAASCEEHDELIGFKLYFI